MSNEEFEVLDELYFVVSYQDIVATVDLEESIVRDALHALLRKGFVKCFAHSDGQEEVAPEALDFTHRYQQYTYLATKQGLLAHNAL